MTPTRQEAIEAMKIVKDWCNFVHCKDCPIHTTPFANMKKQCTYDMVTESAVGMPHTWEIAEQ